MLTAHRKVLTQDNLVGKALEPPASKARIRKHAGLTVLFGNLGHKPKRCDLHSDRVSRHNEPNQRTHGEP